MWLGEQVASATASNVVDRCRVVALLDHLLVKLEDRLLGLVDHVAGASSTSWYAALEWSGESSERDARCWAGGVGSSGEVFWLELLDVACAAPS